MPRSYTEEERAQADLYAQRPVPQDCYRDEAGRLRSPHKDNPIQQALKELICGLYDLQKLRVAAGNRLCSQVRVRLGQLPGLPANDTLSPEVRQLLIDIKEANGKLGTAVANLSSEDIERAANDLEMQEDSPDSSAADAEESADPKADKAAKEVAKLQERILELIEADFDAITNAPQQKPRIPTKMKKGEAEEKFALRCREAKIKLLAWETKRTAAAAAGEDVLKPARLPTKEKFTGTLVISTYTELLLAASYLELNKQENAHKERLKGVLQDFPIYSEFLVNITGCGPMLSAVILGSLDPYTAHSPSSFWKYCGLDVVQVTDSHGNTWGEGRGRYSHHLEPRWYTTKDGEREIRSSLTFSPWVKTKLVGVLAASFLRTGLRREKLTDENGREVKGRQIALNKYVQAYLDYKHRLESHPIYGPHNDWRRDDIRNEYYRLRKVKKVTDRGEEEEAEETDQEKEAKAKKGPGFFITTPGRRNRMALRYMIKIFLVDLHMAWRKLEGLPVTLPYHEAKLQMKHLG